MKKKDNKKRIIIISSAVVALILIGAGIWFFLQYQNDKKRVEVVPVSNVSTSYWGDQTYSSGTVSTDYIQKIEPDLTKQIEEIYVKQGDPVKIGDPLLKYDSTKLELDVEKYKLQGETIDFQIEAAQTQLKKLQNTKPSVNPTVAPPVIITPKPGEVTPTPEPTPTPVPSPTPIPPADVTVNTVLDANSVPYKGSGTTDDPYVYLVTPETEITPDFLRRLYGLEPRPNPSNPDEMIYSPFVAIFEVRENNSNYGDIISSFKLNGFNWSGSINTPQTPTLPDENGDNLITWGNETDAFAAPTPTPTPSPTPKPSNNYDDEGYTADQLKKLIEEKKEEIADLQLQKKQSNLDYDKANLQLNNTEVTSNIDGFVKELIDPQTALETSKPFMVITGENAFYLHGSVSENLLGSINIGDTVDATSWETSRTYTAQIVSIDDYPLENAYSYGGGNPNSSSYEFIAVLDEDDTLFDGMYLEITLNVVNSDTSAMYLEKMYIRDDEGGSYVMKAGPDEGRLVKQYVETGKLIYSGQYVEITSGLTMDDYIAFPYGKDVKEGVRTIVQGGGELPEMGGDSDGTTDDSMSDISDGGEINVGDGGGDFDTGGIMPRSNEAGNEGGNEVDLTDDALPDDYNLEDGTDGSPYNTNENEDGGALG